MSYNDYWHGDCTMAQAYLKAYKLRVERDNYNAWLQGLYVYDAICKASPILHDFVKTGTKPMPYVEKPYAITSEQRKIEAEEQERIEFERGLLYMQKLAADISNAKRGETECPSLTP